MAKTEAPVIDSSSTANEPARRKRANPSRRRWLLVIGLLAAGLLALFLFRGSRPQEVSVAVVSEGPIEASFTAEGSVKGTDYPVGSELGGRIVRLPFREGDPVRRGEILLSVLSDEADAGVSEAAAALEASQSEVRRAGANLRAASIEVESRIAAAEAAVVEAKSGLARTRVGARPEELAQATQRVERAKVAIDHAKQILARATFLYGQGATARESLDSAEAGARSAAAELKGAEAYLALLRAGPRNEDVSVAAAAVDRAGAELGAARSGRAGLVALQEAVHAARAMADRAEASMSRARAARSKIDVRAPADGVVTRLNVEPGSVIAPGAVAMVVSSRADLRIETEISSEDAGKIEPGMAVAVTSAAYPGRSFDATVVSILPVGELKPDAAIRTRIIRTWVALRSGWEFFRPGMEVDVEGRREVKRALCVPNDALTLSGTATSVWVVSDGRAARRDVKTGYGNSEVTEVLSGLRAGDRIVVAGSEGLSDGTRVAVRK